MPTDPTVRDEIHTEPGLAETGLAGLGDTTMSRKRVEREVNTANCTLHTAHCTLERVDVGEQLIFKLCFLDEFYRI